MSLCLSPISNMNINLVNVKIGSVNNKYFYGSNLSNIEAGINRIDKAIIFLLEDFSICNQVLYLH